jgi:RNA polymerase sigma-70 factor (TIGR02943 family)
VDEYGDYLYNFAFGRVFSKEIAEDLLQETFVSALRSAAGFRGESSELTWLVAILKRKIIDHYRRQSSKKETPASDFEMPFQKDGAFKGHWIMERAPKMISGVLDDPLHRKEFRSILEDCLSHLPERWKAVFILRVMEEISTDEVCKELDCTASNLWVMLHRARLKLRECIETLWEV